MISSGTSSSRTVSVSEVASIGGYVKQYQVEVDPDRLLAYHITIPQIRMAIQRSNNDVGGRLVEMAETEFMVRGLGYIQSKEDIERVVVGTDGKGTVAARAGCRQKFCAKRR